MKPSIHSTLRGRSLCLNLFLLFTLPLLHARAVTFEQLSESLKTTHPEIQAADLARTLAEESQRRAFLTDGARVHIDGEQIGGDHSGVSEAELSVSLSQEVAWPGRRRILTEEKSLEVEWVRVKAEKLERKLLLDLALQFHETIAFREGLKLQNTAVVQAEHFIQTAQQRMAAGLSTVLEVNKAKALLERRTILRDQTRLKFTANKEALFLLAGWSDPADALEENMDALPAPPSLDKVISAWTTRPDFQLAALERLKAKNASAAAGYTAWGLPEVGAGIKQDRSTDSQSFLVGVSIPLPLWGQAAAARVKAGLKEQITALEEAAVDLRVQWQARHIHETLEEEHLKIIRYRDVLLPLLNGNASDAARSYQEGVIGYLDMLDADNDLLEAQTVLLEAKARYFIAQSRLHFADLPND